MCYRAALLLLDVLLDGNHLHGLSLALVHGVPLVFDTVEVDPVQVDAAYIVVVGCLVVHFAMGEVDGRCPLCATGYVGAFATLVLYADGDVKVVEQVETLRYGAERVGALGCGVAEEGGTYKT